MKNRSRTQTTELCLFNPFPVLSLLITRFPSPLNGLGWFSVTVLLKTAWVEGTCLMFSSCLWVNSHTLPPYAENESWNPIWLFFFFVATDTKVLKATARFPSLSSSEPSTSAISTVRCWGWTLSEPLIKNRGKQHPWKAKIFQTHRL